MRVYRFADPDGRIAYARPAEDGYELLLGDPLEGLRPTGESARVSRLLAPLTPSAILCIGLNYRAHAEETGSPLPEHPILFMKNPAAVIGPDEPVVIPGRLPSTEVDYECELAVVIGRRCKNVNEEQALNFVLGYTCANDVSARDWQKRGGGGQWCRGKSFDTFCPLGPCLVTPEDIPAPQGLALKTEVNGVTRQESNTSDMIFPIPSLIAFLSGSMTLLPGTVILTGTPSGVAMGMESPAWLRPGDRVAVEIEGIGRLENPVMAEEGVEPLASHRLKA
jgi:2-keto-4-pentenoate hydratase/2-oxohepta-3-ene-1,7-dioic acid hydratase in catechol pathway